MALLSRFFSNRKNSREKSCSCGRFDQQKRWVPPSFDKQQIRLVLFHDHDLKGRRLVFDSKAVKKMEENHESSPRSKCPGRSARREPGKPPPSPADGGSPRQGHRHMTRPSSDAKMLAEMMFGSVAMSYKGSTLKVHSIRSPPQLMVTKVYAMAKHNKDGTGETESFDNYSLNNSVSENSTPRQISQTDKSGHSLAHSIPVDVPQQPPKRDGQNEDDYDSGFMASGASSGSSVTTPFPSPSSSRSSSMNSNSYNSIKRRWARSHATSLEHNLNVRLSDDCPPLPLDKRPFKLGIGIIFYLPEGNTEENRRFHQFFFSHITLIENHVNKLGASVDQTLSKREVHMAAMEAMEDFRGALNDLYTAPRLPQPMWLNMMCMTSHRVHMCQQFLCDLMAVVEKYDTKNTNFFVSTLVTAVLSHHLAWVPTVIPAGATPSRTYLDKHSAKWMDTLAKSHPYNPLWAQLGDMYGAIGYPMRLSRTIVLGKKSDVITRLLHVLSYFIRCSEVQEFIEQKLVLANEESSRDIVTNTDTDDAHTLTPSSLDSNKIHDFRSPLSPRELVSSPCSDTSVAQQGAAQLGAFQSATGSQYKGKSESAVPEAKSTTGSQSTAGFTCASRSQLTDPSPQGVSCFRSKFVETSQQSGVPKSDMPISCGNECAKMAAARVSEVHDGKSNESVSENADDCSDNEKCRMSPTFVVEAVPFEKIRHIGRSAVVEETELSVISSSHTSPFSNFKSQSVLLHGEVLPVETLSVIQGNMCQKNKDSGTAVRDLFEYDADERPDSGIYEYETKPPVPENVNLVSSDTHVLESNPCAKNDKLSAGDLISELPTENTVVDSRLRINGSREGLVLHADEHDDHDDSGVFDAHGKRQVVLHRVPLGPAFEQDSSACTSLEESTNSDYQPNGIGHRPLMLIRSIHTEAMGNIFDEYFSGDGVTVLTGLADKSIPESIAKLPTAYKRQISDGSVSVFDEYMDENLPVTDSGLLLKPKVQYERGISQESSRSMFDEYFSGDSDPILIPSETFGEDDGSKTDHPNPDTQTKEETLYDDKNVQSKEEIAGLGDFGAKQSEKLSDVMEKCKGCIGPCDHGINSAEANTDSDSLRSSASATTPNRPSTLLGISSRTCKPDTKDLTSLLPGKPETAGQKPSYLRQGSTVSNKSKASSNGASCRQRHVSGASCISTESTDSMANLVEVQLPRSNLTEDLRSRLTFECNFGSSLLAGYNDHYMSDFVLQGTSDQGIYRKVLKDLTMSVQNSVLDEQIAEATCILADTEKWNVKVMSCQYSQSENHRQVEWTASQLISNCIESVHDMWKLKMSPEFCLMHLEDRLQEVYFKSTLLAEYLNTHQKINMQELPDLLGFHQSDLPLLLAVAGTYTQHLGLMGLL